MSDPGNNPGSDLGRAQEPSPTPFTVGDPAPWFVLPSSDPAGPYHFDKAGGRYVALLLARSATALSAILTAISPQLALFDGINRLLFTLTTDGAAQRLAADPGVPGLFHLFDAQGTVLRRFGLEGDVPHWVILDPQLRAVAVLDARTIAPAAVIDMLSRVPDASARPMSRPVPVTILPDVFEPSFCAALIAAYHRQGFQHSGVFTQDEDVTRRAIDMQFKRRRDSPLEDPALRDAAASRLQRRVVPEIARVFQVGCDYIDRMLIASYDAAERGRFGAHRDNTMRATRYRQFAISINLNEGFTGGGVSFPEYGPQPFAPPPGGALVFSCGLLHRVEPVTAGARFAFLTFAYDEAHATRRRRDWQEQPGGAHAHGAMQHDGAYTGASEPRGERAHHRKT